MEDAHVALDDISPMTSGRTFCQPQGFYGVFDGHGGCEAADYLKNVLLGRVMSDKDFPTKAGRAMTNAFLQADRELENQWISQGREADAGTTALAALVLGRMLFVANAGDCRAVMSSRGRAVDITRDHRTALPAERARVLEAGGTISDDYLNDKLAVTRALGDWHMEDLKRRSEANGATTTTGPLIAEPDVFESVLAEGDEFMVMACDGLWDAFQGRSQDVIDFARRHLSFHNDPLQCSKDLVQHALREDGSDNITVVVICFKQGPPVDLSRRAPAVNGAERPMRKCLSVEALANLQVSLNNN